MESKLSQEFPRLEFKHSKWPYQITGYATCLILPAYLVRTVVAMLPPAWAVSFAIRFLMWCTMAAGCLVILSKLLPKTHFDKPMIAIEPEAVTLQFPANKVLPWTSISKIKFYESGRYNQ